MRNVHKTELEIFMTITKTWGEWHCIDENGVTVSPRFLTKEEACYWLVQFKKDQNK